MVTSTAAMKIAIMHPAVTSRRRVATAAETGGGSTCEMAKGGGPIELMLLNRRVGKGAHEYPQHGTTVNAPIAPSKTGRECP